MASDSLAAQQLADQGHVRSSLLNNIDFNNAFISNPGPCAYPYPVTWAEWSTRYVV